MVSLRCLLPGLVWVVSSSLTTGFPYEMSSATYPTTYLDERIDKPTTTEIPAMRSDFLNSDTLQKLQYFKNGKLSNSEIQNKLCCDDQFKVISKRDQDYSTSRNGLGHKNECPEFQALEEDESKLLSRAAKLMKAIDGSHSMADNVEPSERTRRSGHHRPCIMWNIALAHARPNKRSEHVPYILDERTQNVYQVTDILGKISNRIENQFGTSTEVGVTPSTQPTHVRAPDTKEPIEKQSEKIYRISAAISRLAELLKEEENGLPDSTQSPPSSDYDKRDIFRFLENNNQVLDTSHSRASRSVKPCCNPCACGLVHTNPITSMKYPDKRT